MNRSVFLMLLCLVAATIRSPAWADGPDSGERLPARLDWTSGVLEASGRATAVDHGTSLQREMVAQTAARVMAQKAMAEVLKGVRVRALTTIGDMTGARPQLLASVGGLVMSAVPVVDKVEWTSGGPDGERVPWATVTLRLCFDRISPVCAKAPATLYEVLDLPRLLPLPRRTFGDADAGRYLSGEEAERYSGLVVDLGQLDFMPVLSPDIVTPDGKIVFAGRRVDSRILAIQGPVRYVETLQAVRHVDWVGSSPLVIRAQAVTGDNQIVIDPRDAAILVRASLKNDDFLRLGRVALVLP